uniref:Uncharacterized protein n=1 Tax=Caenorhabditis japonica TaxID=281687 RepID=A0A8R1ESC4_CAEJA
MSKLGGATARVVKSALRVRQTSFRAALTLTNEAVSRIRQLLEQQTGANALKVSIDFCPKNGRKCSIFSQKCSRNCKKNLALGVCVLALRIYGSLCPFFR